MKIRDIAEKAGVSTATVSNVINGNYHKVSKTTIEKVQKIIEENDYKPNATARSLALKESRIIGVVIPNLAENEAFSTSAYYSEMVAILESYVRKQGYYLMIRSVEKCMEMIPIFSAWNVDGVILLGAFRSEVPDIEKLLKVPTVYIDTYADDLEIANVGIDDYKGGYLAARYLLGKGHRKIAFAGPSIDSPGVIRERFRGFSDACKERRGELTPEHVFEAETLYEQGVEVAKKIAFSNMGFTAVATMSDTLAFGVMEGLRLCGVNIPGDISVIGFDNLPACKYTNPKLTTVSQNLELKANRAADYLFDMIRNKKKMVVDEKIDVEIVERQSVKELFL